MGKLVITHLSINGSGRFMIWLPFLLTLALPCFSQHRQPDGRFLADSIRTGEVVAFTLSFRYPSAMEAVFPDSSYNFYPFEFVRKDYFPTVSNDGTSYDSAVYHLTTFDIQPLLPLALPVIVLENGDSSAYFSEKDTLYFRETVAVLPDSIALKDTSFYREVEQAFNYPYAAAALAGLIIVAGLLALVFGKQIKRRFILFRLEKDYAKYMKRISIAIEQINGNASEKASVAVTEWKKYLETLDNKPLTKLTTKEIIRTYEDKSLEDPLKGIDRTLYGSISDPRLREWLGRLVEYSKERYHEKIREVKHV